MLFRSPEVGSLLDLSRPVAVLLIAVLHFVPDADDPYGIVAGIRDRLAPGSYLVLSHGCPDEEPEAADQVQQAYRGTATPLSLRDRAHVQQMFTGFDLVEPGLTWATAWRPDEPEPERRELLAGVGWKR